MGRRPTRSLAALAAGAMLLTGCADEGQETVGQNDTDRDVTSEPAATDDAENGRAEAAADPIASESSGSFTLGDEEYAAERVMCFFEEYDAPGVGVQTHSVQADSTNSAGQEVTFVINRFRHDDGDISVRAGVDTLVDPDEGDYASWLGTGPDSAIAFSDEAALAEGIEVRGPDGIETRLLSFDLRC